MSVIVSRHAEMRLKERTGINRSAMQRMADKAFDIGIQHKETKGNLHKWVSSVYLSYGKANNIRLYGDKAYIFCDLTLVTVLQIPSNLRNDMRSMINDRSDNAF